MTKPHLNVPFAPATATSLPSSTASIEFNNAGSRYIASDAYSSQVVHNFFLFRHHILYLYLFYPFSPWLTTWVTKLIFYALFDLDGATGESIDISRSCKKTPSREAIAFAPWFLTPTSAGIWLNKKAFMCSTRSFFSIPCAVCRLPTWDWWFTSPVRVSLHAHLYLSLYLYQSRNFLKLGIECA